MQGLDKIMEALRAEGRKPDDAGLGEDIVARVRQKKNYIPASAQYLFTAALAREYAAYLTRLESGASPKRGYGTWRGYPREAIPWFPTVNEDLCNGCSVCLKLCSTHCLAPTEDGKVWVTEPMACVIGCSSCANVCKPKAITFPPRSMLDAYKLKV